MDSVDTEPCLSGSRPAYLSSFGERRFVERKSAKAQKDDVVVSPFFLLRHPMTKVLFLDTECESVPQRRDEVTCSAASLSETVPKRW